MSHTKDLFCRLLEQIVITDEPLAHPSLEDVADSVVRDHLRLMVDQGLVEGDSTRLERLDLQIQRRGFPEGRDVGSSLRSARSGKARLRRGPGPSLAPRPLGPSPQAPAPAGRRRAVGRLVAGLVIGAMFPVAFADCLEAEEAENPYTGGIDVRMGQRFFLSKCTSCHGVDAKGGVEADGPDLTTGSFRHATTGAGLFRVIRGGIEGTSMRGLRREKEQVIWQLVTYLRTLSANVELAELPGSVAKGRAMYERLGCGRCHMVQGRGGRLDNLVAYLASLRGSDS